MEELAAMAVVRVTEGDNDRVESLLRKLGSEGRDVTADVEAVACRCCDDA